MRLGEVKNNMFWQYTTVLIELDNKKQGTGFFVKEKNKVFLVTVKHILNKELIENGTINNIYLYVNKKLNNKITVDKIQIPLNLTKLISTQINDDGISAFDITDNLSTNNQIYYECVTFDLFGDNKDLRIDERCMLGQEVFIIGYPILTTASEEIHAYDQASLSPIIRIGESNLPIVRIGNIATPIAAECIKIIEPECEKTYKDTFLIDGGVIPGSSGSPVIFKPQILEYTENGEITPSRPLFQPILGIIAKTTYANDFGKNKERLFAGIGIAIKISVVRETINKFFNSF